MSNRHLGRTLVLQTLFEWDFHEGKQSPQDILQHGLDEFSNKFDDIEFTQHLLSGVLDTLDEINTVITQYAPDWPLEQIAPYECARKIIGTTPTLVCTGIPHNVETYSRSRWCLSVRYKSPELTSWKNTVDFFRPWIKNVNS